MEHDHAYKLLFSRPELVADLLRDFVREPWVEGAGILPIDRPEPFQQVGASGSSARRATSPGYDTRARSVL